MKFTSLAVLALAPLTLLAAAPAQACAPPPPGWVEPTRAQLRAVFVESSADIVYGRIEAQQSGPPVLRVYHVYKGNHRPGDRIAVPSGYDFPVPVCAGMVPPPPPKPVGTYGVFAVRSYGPESILIGNGDVQAMIDEGLIRSARAR
jgi:hypothetical protein